MYGNCKRCGSANVEEIRSFTGDLVDKSETVGYRCRDCSYKWDVGAMPDLKLAINFTVDKDDGELKLPFDKKLK